MPGLETETESATTKPYGSQSRVISNGTMRSGEDYAPTLQTSGRRATGGEMPATPVSGRPRTSREIVEPQLKHKTRALFQASLDNLDRAIDNEAEFFLRNNALEQMKDSLAELWAIRDKREEAFAEIVNTLQGIFAGRNVEAFDGERLATLRCVFVRLRDKATFDDEFANDITLELLKGDVDVFREID